MAFRLVVILVAFDPRKHEALGRHRIHLYPKASTDFLTAQARSVNCQCWAVIAKRISFACRRLGVHTLSSFWVPHLTPPPPPAAPPGTCCTNLTVNTAPPPPLPPTSALTLSTSHPHPTTAPLINPHGNHRNGRARSANVSLCPTPPTPPAPPAPLVLCLCVPPDPAADADDVEVEVEARLARRRG